MDLPDDACKLAEKIRTAEEDAPARAALRELAQGLEKDIRAILSDIRVPGPEVDALIPRVWDRIFRSLRGPHERGRGPLTPDGLISQIRFEAVDERAVRLVAQIRESHGENTRAFDDLFKLFEKPFAGCVKFGLRKLSLESSEIVERAPKILQNVRNETWDRIRSTPAEGGYNPEEGKFYTYVKECIIRYKVLQWQDVDGPGALPPDRRVSLDSAEGKGLTSPPSDDPELKLKAYEETFRLVFSDRGGYPHQQLTFGFSKLVYSRTGSRGDSRMVDSLHGSLILHLLTSDFWEAYLRMDQNLQDDEAMRERFKGYLEPLRERLDMEVKSLFSAQDDHASLSAYQKENPDILDQETGDTCIRDYYGRRDYEACIPDWCNKVKQRVRGKVIVTPAEHQQREDAFKAFKDRV